MKIKPDLRGHCGRRSIGGGRRTISEKNVLPKLEGRRGKEFSGERPLSRKKEEGTESHQKGEMKVESLSREEGGI